MDTTNLEFARATALLERAGGYRGAVPRIITLVIDWGGGKIYAETRDPSNRALPESRWNGLEDAYLLPPTVDASRLREWVEDEVLPRIEPLAKAFETVWIDGRKVGRFPGEYEDMKRHFDQWMAIHADPPQHRGGLWTAEDWLGPSVPEVRPDSSYDDLMILAQDIVAEASRENVVIVDGARGVYEHLRGIRDSLKGPDTYEIEGFEVLEKVARPVGTTAHVFVPRSWVGKRVKIVRVDR